MNGGKANGDAAPPVRSPAGVGWGTRLAGWAAVIRAHDWWTYKVAMILATGYATAIELAVSPARLWSTWLFLVAALVLVAMFASLINDLCDLHEDRIAGKRNQLEGLSRGRVAALFLACLGPGGVLLGTLWKFPAQFAIYLANWVIFALYSVPPMRLKSRAGWGILAIALGESLLPNLLAVLVVGAGAARPVPSLWIALVGIWSFLVGLRSILWHQLRDHDSDREAGVVTFAVQAAPQRVRRLVRWVLFPLECAALLGLLICLGHPAPWIGLAICLFTDLLRNRLSGQPIVVVDPRPHDRLVLFEYYDMFFPLACLAAAIAQDGWNAVLWLVVATSTPRAGWWCREAWMLFRRLLGRLRQRLSARSQCSTPTGPEVDLSRRDDS